MDRLNDHQRNIANNFQLLTPQNVKSGNDVHFPDTFYPRLLISENIKGCKHEDSSQAILSKASMTSTFLSSLKNSLLS